MSTENLKKTPLNEQHKKLGGKMVDFGGWEMPIQYTAGVIEEHLRSGNENSRQMFRDLERTEPRIIHYVGSIKPWESERVLGEYYQHYQKNMEEEDEKKILSLQ